MIKFEIDSENQTLHYECAGDPANLVADTMVCLRKTYDVLRNADEDMAESMILFMVAQLLDPESTFYDEVDWEDEAWEGE